MRIGALVLTAMLCAGSPVPLAIVEVTATAICGADLFPFHGLTPGFEDGTILGHEFAGVVAEVGPGVDGIRPGQRVVNASMISDGTCSACRAGRPTQCSGRALFGYSGVYPRLDGGQAGLVRVPNAGRTLQVLPDEVSDEAAVFLADILPTGYIAVRRCDLPPRAVVCVVGCGPVGLMAVLCALPLAERGVRVAGIYRVADQTDPYWFAEPLALALPISPVSAFSVSTAM